MSSPDSNNLATSERRAGNLISSCRYPGEGKGGEGRGGEGRGGEGRGGEGRGGEGRGGEGRGGEGRGGEGRGRGEGEGGHITWASCKGSEVHLI